MESALKKLLKTIKMNEGTISLFLGVAVVLVVIGMIVNYFRETPTTLPTVEDQLITENVELDLNDDTESTDAGQLALGDQEEQPTATQVPTATIAPTATTAPTNTPTLAPTATTVPTATTAPTVTQAPTITTAPTATTAPRPTSTLAPTATSAPTATPTVSTDGQIAGGVSTSVDEQPATGEQSRTQPATGGTYTVQAGDSLWAIAEKAYSTGYGWTEIARANNLSHPGQIATGQELNLPELSRSYPVTATTTLADADQGTPSLQGEAITGASYDVVKGDNLWRISERAYGNGYQWVRIAQANGLTDNPGYIEIGMTLQIPRDEETEQQNE